MRHWLFPITDPFLIVFTFVYCRLCACEHVHAVCGVRVEGRKNFEESGPFLNCVDSGK